MAWARTAPARVERDSCPILDGAESDGSLEAAVARTVCLHTGTMGAIVRAFYRFEGRTRHPGGSNPTRDHLSCFVYLTYGRAPTGGRLQKLVVLFAQMTHCILPNEGRIREAAYDPPPAQREVDFPG